MGLIPVHPTVLKQYLLASGLASAVLLTALFTGWKPAVPWSSAAGLRLSTLYIIHFLSDLGGLNCELQA